jgi:hypothetical protein
MKTFFLVASGAALVVLADFATQHGYGKLVTGIAALGIGVVLLGAHLTRPGVKRGRK